MRARFATLLVIIMLASTLASCGRSESPLETGESLGVSGTKIIVWDLAQPEIEGVASYRSSVEALVQDYAAQNDVTVDLIFPSRQDVVDVLTGVREGETPDLINTGEWPLVGIEAQDIASYISPEKYYPPMLDYWRSDEYIAAIPAYMYWVGSASRESGEGTVYLCDTPIFLQAALSATAGEWEPDEVADYLEWVRETWGRASSDPLLDWTRGSVHSIYPVTPHLWRSISSKEPGLSLKPVPSKSGDTGFYYTVPGYAVLAGADPHKTCAAQLGILLAQNLGRWAAKALGCVPAYLDDFSVFGVESGLTYDDRAAVLASANAKGEKAPHMTAFLENRELEKAVREVSTAYLLGGETAEAARSGIQEALRRNTIP